MRKPFRNPFTRGIQYCLRASKNCDKLTNLRPFSPRNLLTMKLSDFADRIAEVKKFVKGLQQVMIISGGDVKFVKRVGPLV